LPTDAHEISVVYRAGVGFHQRHVQRVEDATAGVHRGYWLPVNLAVRSAVGECDREAFRRVGSNLDFAGPDPSGKPASGAGGSRPLVATRTRNDLKHFDAPPFGATIADRATIEKLYEDILALPPLPAGRLDCPRDSGLRYRLDFYVGRALLLSGDYAPTGCRTVSLSDGTVKSDSRGSFGTDFVQALGFS
jgi:hypothetical protein